MSKIICDICGTSYLSSAESCPICGFSNKAGEDSFEYEAETEETVEETPEVKGRFSAAARKKEIFDYDEVNPDDEYADDDEDDDDDEEDYDEPEEDEPSHNVFVVILLTVLIVVLLGAAAFIFFRFFLPNMGDKAPETTAPVVVEETTLPPTTEAKIPCQQMVMTNAGVAELNAEGQQFLLHVKALPENTTDTIIYKSGNESIATVSEDGKITAVSEGETAIHISCGEYYIECPVIVKYVEETVPPTTEAIVEETVSETEAAESNPEDVAAEAPADDAGNTASAPRSDVTLKLKKTDIRLGVYYQFRLELDCDLNPEDVQWSSEHDYIAKVDETGNVTAVKEGTTSIIAKYGDQVAECIVRCGWY